MKRYALSLFWAASLCACAMPQGGMMKRSSPAALPPTTQYVDEAVTVVTDPPGAEVRVNGVYAGNSPLRYTVRRYWRGQAPGSLALDMVKVEALPVSAGQCMRSGVFGENNKVLPNPVRFDLADCKNEYEHGYGSLDAPAPAARPAKK